LPPLDQLPGAFGLGLTVQGQSGVHRRFHPGSFFTGVKRPSPIGILRFSQPVETNGQVQGWIRATHMVVIGTGLGKLSGTLSR
jgi:hypothetical protein